MFFDFACKACPEVQTVRSPIGVVPKAPLHCGKRMRRVWSAPRFHITYSIADYANRAYDGTEEVPGLSTAEVRQMVDIGMKPHP